MTTATYDELARHWSRLHRFGHVYSIASWDRAAMMPAKGNEARAEALAEMDALLHGLRTEPRLAELIARAEQEPLGDAERANLREIRRSWIGRTRCRRGSWRSSRSRPRAASTPGEHSVRPATGPAFSPTCATWCALPARRRSTWPTPPAWRRTTR